MPPTFNFHHDDIVATTGPIELTFNLTGVELLEKRKG